MRNAKCNSYSYDIMQYANHVFEQYGKIRVATSTAGRSQVVETFSFSLYIQNERLKEKNNITEGTNGRRWSHRG
jgi:hypothetical protein